MMRSFLVAAASTLFASLSFAADDPMASRYGNTLIATTEDGKELWRAYYDADHTMWRKNADGTQMKGTWKLADGELCVTQIEPAPQTGVATNCLPFPGAKKVGESWTVSLPTGAKLIAKLQKGRP